MTTWAPSWLARATAAWAARETRPVTVRAWLTSPVADDPRDPLSLDGALSWVVVRDAARCTPDDAFADAPRDAYVEIPLPLERTVSAGVWHWRASAAQWPEGARPDVRRWRKRPHPEAYGTQGKVIVAGGPFKALDLPFPTRVSTYVDFHVRADVERLTALLPGLLALGRGRNGGLGSVSGWEILEDPQDRSTEHAGRPTRPVPVESAEDAARRFPGGGYELRVCGVRPPYWHRQAKALAAVPC